MPSISKENEFAKISSDADAVVASTKSKLLKFGYYYYHSGQIFSSTAVEKRVAFGDIKKLKIMSMGIVSIVFFLFGALSFGLGFLNGHDQFTGQMIPAPGSQIAIGATIAIVLFGLGFLYLKSKSGRLKVLQATVGGTPIVIYASLDKAELQQLKDTLQLKS